MPSSICDATRAASWRSAEPLAAISERPTSGHQPHPLAHPPADTIANSVQSTYAPRRKHSFADYALSRNSHDVAQATVRLVTLQRCVRYREELSCDPLSKRTSGAVKVVGRGRRTSGRIEVDDER